MAKKQPKRVIQIEHFDGSTLDLVLSKATAVKTSQKMIHLDELPDGTWRLIYNGGMIPDFTKVKQLVVIREDN